MPARRPPIIAHHLIWTLYGHWLANDLRGSGSSELREGKFNPLGPIHQDRKPEWLQPSRYELRAFHQQAAPLLQHDKFWLDDTKRQQVVSGIGEVVSNRNYTVYACAVLSNHMHMVIRIHRDDALTMWHQIEDTTRLRLREDASVADDHPVWASRPFKKFLTTPEAVRRCIEYVEVNPEKEGLSPQRYAFAVPYDNWPYHKRK